MEQLRLPPAGEECRAAFATVKAAKTFFWWVVFFCVLAQLVSFVLVRVAGVIDHAPALATGEPLSVMNEPARTAVPATRPASGPTTTGPEATSAPTSRPAPSAAPSATTTAATRKAAAKPAAPAAETRKAQLWYEQLIWIMPATKFLALAASVLLTVAVLLALQLSIVGRTGGAGPLASGFMWSLVLLMLLFPWSQILPGTPLAGALYSLDDLIAATKTLQQPTHQPTWTVALPYYARFVFYPAFALLVWMLVQSKFSLGYRRMRVSTQADIIDVGPTEKL